MRLYGISPGICQTIIPVLFPYRRIDPAVQPESAEHGQEQAYDRSAGMQTLDNISFVS